MRSKGSPPRTIRARNSITIVVKNNKKQRYSGCLAHAVIGMFCSVAANQRQPRYTCNVLRRRWQPRPTIIYVYKYVIHFKGVHSRYAWKKGGEIAVATKDCYNYNHTAESRSATDHVDLEPTGGISVGPGRRSGLNLTTNDR